MSERLLHTAAAPFEAARRVSILPEGHRSRRLHGHGFLARVRADLPPDWAPFPGGETGALSEALKTCVAALDYRDLNEQLPIPTDENLARWIRQCLVVPGIETVGVQSTRDQGADLDARDQVHVWRRFRFEAAHQLPQCARGPPVRAHARARLRGHPARQPGPVGTGHRGGLRSSGGDLGTGPGRAPPRLSQRHPRPREPHQRAPGPLGVGTHQAEASRPSPG